MALPLEHGGWAFLLEPIALGLLLAPSFAGFCIALSALSAFLARQPLKLAAGDRIRNRLLPRTALAQRFAALYLTAATLCIVGAAFTTRNHFLLPLIFAAPFTAAQFFFDARGRSRALPAEFGGAIATGSIAVAIALAAGWNRPSAFALWAVMLARAVPSLLYVRARLRSQRGKAASPFLVISVHVLALGLVLALAKSGIVSGLAVIAFGVLLFRAAFGFLKRNQTATPKQIGFQEIGYGAMTVYAVAIGQVMGL